MDTTEYATFRYGRGEVENGLKVILVVRLVDVTKISISRHIFNTGTNDNNGRFILEKR